MDTFGPELISHFPLRYPPSAGTIDEVRVMISVARSMRALLPESYSRDEITIVG